MQPAHSRILTEASRNRLAPLGLVRKGRSRTWLDDRGWFVTVVEFQPSGWSKGTHLNVGAHFLWKLSGHLSFDLGHRVEGFTPYESDDQFAPEADRIARLAAAEVLSLRGRLPEPAAVASIISSSAGWSDYHRAVSLGLSRQSASAARAFLRIVETEGDHAAWFVELREQCRRFPKLVADYAAFCVAIDELIAQQRKSLRLPGIGEGTANPRLQRTALRAAAEPPGR